MISLNRIDWGEPLTYSGGERWLHVTLDGDDVLVRVVRGPAARFEAFSVEFLRGEEVTVSIKAVSPGSRQAMSLTLSGPAPTGLTL